MFNSNISISISDDDSDDLAGKMRVRGRRKRKKWGFRGRNELAQRFIRKLLRWWPFLLFLPAAGLLVFEASRIGRKPSPDPGRISQKNSGPVVESKSEGNLNHLDPTTRVVRGVRERKSLSECWNIESLFMHLLVYLSAKRRIYFFYVLEQCFE